MGLIRWTPSLLGSLDTHRSICWPIIVESNKKNQLQVLPVFLSWHHILPVCLVEEKIKH